MTGRPHERRNPVMAYTTCRSTVMWGCGLLVAAVLVYVLGLLLMAIGFA